MPSNERDPRKDPKAYDRTRVDGRIYTVGGYTSGGQIEALESTKDGDHPLRKSKRTLFYLGQWRRTMQDAEVLHVAE